jgi:REP element-mobilizing transposase RayT
MSQDHNHLNHATWECKYEKGHLMPDHVHADIPPKYSAAEVIGYLKGKSSIWMPESQAAEFSGSQILGEDRRAERGDDRRLH